MEMTCVRAPANFVKSSVQINATSGGSHRSSQIIEMFPRCNAHGVVRLPPLVAASGDRNKPDPLSKGLISHLCLTMTSSTSSDCPICLEELSASEHTFPLPCRTCVDFTYCSRCVEQFVRSSQDDYQMASDGSRQVKVHVACPQCRSKYPMDISKVLLLRKVHSIGLKAFDRDGKAIEDSDLNATQLSIKRDLFSHKKKRQVELAHGLYLKVMEGKVDLAKMVEAEKVCERFFHGLPESAADSTDDEEDDEYVDNPSSPKRPKIPVDSSLFQGLHDFLGWDEKVFLTQLFTSGEVSKLAQAAMILNGVLKLSMQPPSMRSSFPENRNPVNYKKASELLKRTKASFPLAMYMPGYFLVPNFPSQKQYLSFKDQTWNGMITPPAQSKNIFQHVYGDHYHPPNAENPRPIVVIDGVRGPAGRVGLRKGDVVTHINEMEWTGTASELLEHIHELYEQSPDDLFSITVNATPEAALFLKVRKELMEKARIELLS